MMNHLPMNTTHEYTDEQLQAAIDAAFAKPTIYVTLSTRSYKERNLEDQRYTRLRYCPRLPRRFAADHGPAYTDVKNSGTLSRRETNSG